ncbi:hypothetical protein KAR91_37015 [Candidatus Pacearchaeota archaeon]|nr:hypothetical protein [Candidatus Pacearchaeota archaeon]
MKKNCYNCKYFNDKCDPDNVVRCDRPYHKLEIRDGNEANMAREDYLKRGKRCFKPKQK